PQFPIIEWSTYWYNHLFGLTPPSRIAPLPINEALVRSLVLSVMTMIVSTVLGVTSAQAFRRRGPSCRERSGRRRRPSQGTGDG
ncbi:hypothetical protein ACC713_37340, partial [Rhizobium johnstonii]